MKTKIKTMALVFAAASTLFIISCQKDEETTAKPAITLTELGYDNSKIGYSGSDLHIEADIVAERKIDKVTIQIHPEGDHGDKSASLVFHEGEWEVDTTYTEFAGLKNTTFHKHIAIPVSVEVGHYHFHFAVTDLEGNQTIVEEELEIQHPADAVPPVVTITTAPTANQVFTNGQTISISGSVSDDLALGGMYIGLVGVDQVLTDALVNDGNTISLLHHHDFPNPTSHSYLASIVVGAAMDNNNTPKAATWTPGEYYIVVKCQDSFGGNWTFSNHYPIVIN